jgi:TetR/AcrR family transcriptional repressor of mexJK operon
VKMISNIHKKTAGRPVDHQKTQSVFEAIDNILANEGISGLSIERIAKKAEISKATLYRRFGDIQGVLSAYVETFTQNALDKTLHDKSINKSNSLELEQILVGIGIELMKLISHPRVIAFDNAMLSAGPKFITFKEEMYRAGPQKAVSQIGELLESVGVTSLLFDSNSLGDILFHIWRSGFYDKARITGQVLMNDEQLEQHITAGTRFFLSRII